MADRYDVVVVGAGAAGLSAALMLGRSRRRTLVLDGGPPRNAPAAHSHGLFTRDGVPPGELLRLGKKDLEAYPSVEVREAVAVGASGSDGNFQVEVSGGERVSARKILLASGVVDEMPDIPGFTEAWGKGIFHCPYCHGWEVRERALAVFESGASLMHRVLLVRNLSRDLVAITDGAGVSDEDRGRLSALGVPLYESGISRIESDEEGEKLVRIVLGDGTEIEREGLFMNPPQRQRSELAEMLGCEMKYVGMMRGYTISVDPMTRETSVKGVFAAGDAGIPPAQSLPNAVATGANAATFINYALASDDVAEELSGVASSP
ncbi:Thioredoxin reductase [Rubrobacter xylanophilus DSM 9941]|uniref:NAD(P)/FAD-dependent oxidoreductase n=1 Tax=Rubrobacter xylanophilus TaxID=49319 RepID=UPI001C63C8AE|nr:NAD(P)/FAD-dependent oxidoreductase [Rubrobacter xylanophilus]QYJ15223.1 Thioredoxin reductase [Rubrobacter xylanophilus DSM 9941]